MRERGDEVSEAATASDRGGSGSSGVGLGLYWGHWARIFSTLQVEHRAKNRFCGRGLVRICG